MILCLVCRSPNLYTKAENLYVCNDCGNEWEQFTPKVYAVDTNRNYIGFELDKHYCDIANERIQKAMQDKEEENHA